MADEHDLDKYIQGVKLTGFPLEYSIGEALKNDRWNIINNKHYIDSNNLIPREIDLIAYKASKNAKGVMVFTTLIISCKKSDDRIWALLSKDVAEANPNTDWWPLHMWSNDKVLQFEISQHGRKKKYHTDANTLGVKNFGKPSVDVFAFQELDINTGKPQNDKRIYGSVSSLIQAQAYELKALPDRKKREKSIYQFNLISLVQGKLLTVHFDGTDIKPNYTRSENHISRYIIDKSETFSRIQFIQNDAFKESLQDYTRLHAANLKISEMMVDEFYAQVITDNNRSRIFYKEFRDYLSWYLKYTVKEKLSKEMNFEDITFRWDSKNKILLIDNIFDEEVCKFLNENEPVQKRTSKALLEIYRYSGSFMFDLEEIPF